MSGYIKAIDYIPYCPDCYESELVYLSLLHDPATIKKICASVKLPGKYVQKYIAITFMVFHY